MKKTVIVCSSHLYIPTALSYILKHHEDKHYIYTNNHSITQLFEYSQLNVEIWEEPKFLEFPHILNCIQYKKWIIKRIKNIKIDRFVFFHDGFCMPINWVLKKQRNKTEILYCPTFTDNVTYVHINNVKQIKEVVKNLLFWNIKIIPAIGLNGGIIPYLKPNFFEAINARKIKIAIDEQVISYNMHLICPSISYMEKKKIVFLQCELVGLSISEIDYIRTIDKIIDYVGVDNGMFKAKPGRERCYGKELNLNKIPDYISASLILKNFKLVIGTNSAVLAQAANEGILSISLINVMPFQNKNDRKFVTEYLSNLSPHIKFPQTIEEVLLLINKEK